MSRLAGLISVLGAGMAGYGKGVQQRRVNEREDRRDAQQQEEYDYQKDQRAKAQQLDDAVGTALAPQAVQEIPGQDMSAADLSMAGPQPTRYQVGDQTFGDETQARAALHGVNSRAARYQRAADSLGSGHGAAGVDMALKFEGLAKKALDEGTDKILTIIQSSAPSLADLKKAGGMVAGTVGKEAADVFSQTGGAWKVAPDTVVQHYLDKDAAGREFVNSRVLAADGRPLVGDVVHAGLALQDYKTRMEAQANDTRTYQTGQQIAESGRHNKAEEGISRQSAATAAAHLGIARQSLKLQQEAAFAATPAGQIAALEKANGAPLTADQKMEKLGLSRISKPDQMLVASILKSQEQLDQARAKAMADGSFLPDSPGAKELAAQSAANHLKLNRVLGKYGDAGKGAASADPLGILGADAPAPAAAPRAAARGVAKPTPAATASGASVDMRADPTLQALNEGAAKLSGKTDPASVQQLMALGTAKNARIAQLQKQYGAMTNFITE
jgi:hypothetical protein